MGTNVFDSLTSFRGGDPEAINGLIPVLYDELRGIANRQMNREHSPRTLRPTALVHEAYLRLLPHRKIDPADRTRFLCLAASAMRRVLIDHARNRGMKKRGGNPEQVTLDENLAAEQSDTTFDIETLEEALTKLESLSPRSARVVELKFFAGLKREEIAAELAVSVRTVADDWTMARRWLARELTR